MGIPVGADGSIEVRGSTTYPFRRANRGFTLHETLMVLVVVSVLTVGVASFNRLLRSTHSATQVNALVADLNLARSEAIKRAYTVTVCKSNSATACTSDSAWHEGWLIITDRNENGQLDDDDEILRVGPALTGGTQLTFNAWGVGTGKYVSYFSNGTTQKNGTFRFCNIEGSKSARAVILIQTGRVRTTSSGVTCP